MLLTIDIGNSNIVFSLSGSERKLYRLETMPDRSAEEYLPQVAELFSREKVDLSVVDGAVLCSVVPELVPVMSRVTRELTGLTPYFISPASESGLTLAIAEADTLGADILAADAAAAAEYPLPAIIYDMGTATTVTVVDKDRRYIGGAILPGVRLGINALFSGTAQLPSVPVQAPPRAICGTALESIQSGAVFGAAAMMDGLADRFEAELGEKCTLIATGGLAGCIVPHCRRDFIYDESLLLRGMELIYRLNCEK